MRWKELFPISNATLYLNWMKKKINRKISGRRHIFLDEKSVLGGHLSQVHFVN